MTALELADKLDNQFGNKYAPNHYKIIQEAVAMLRKQAEEIAALQQK